MKPGPTPEELAELNAGPTPDELAELNGTTPKPAPAPPEMSLGDKVAKAFGPETIPGTLGRKFGAGAAMGLLPAINGAATAIGGGISDNLEDLGAVDSAHTTPLRGATGPLDYLSRTAGAAIDRYRQGRKAMVDDLDASSKAHPAISAGSELAGALAVPLPFGKAKAAGLVPKLVQGAKVGAAVGGLNALGNSEADIMKPDEWGKLLGDTAEGVGGGAVGGSVLSGVAAKAEPWLQKAAELKAFQGLKPRVALGGLENKMKELESKSPTGDPLAAQRALGRRALDEGIVAPFGTAEGAAKRTEPALEEAGALKRGVLQTIQDQNPSANVSIPAVASKLEQAGRAAQAEVGSEQLGGHLLNQSQRLRDTAMRRQAAGLSDYLNLLEAEDSKTRLQKLANYARQGPMEDARKQAASTMRQAVEDEAERVAGPDELDVFKAAKAKYGQLADLSEIGEYGAKRAARNGSGLASEIANRIALDKGPKEAVTAHIYNALADAAKERAPQTKAVLYDAAAKGNQSLARGGMKSLADYLYQENKDKDEPHL